MSRDFPFLFALLGALALHALLGVVLKYNPLVAAVPLPLPPPPKAPVSVRFVEVPPDAKTVASPPNTNNVSDANRKAGPLVPNRERAVIAEPRTARSVGRERPAARSEEKGLRREGKTAQQQRQVQLPAIESPDLGQAPGNSARLPEISMPRARLSQSLRNLDQFIDHGGADAGGGDEPSGDTGSGVFFDTRGFDLGPWGNRVVAIVKKNWMIPVAADLGVKGVVGISFHVDRMGNIHNLQVISSSNVPSFDQAALNALRSSNPFPPLPGDFPRPTLAAVFRFYYNTPVPK